MSNATTTPVTRQQGDSRHAIPRLDYEDGGKRYTNSAAAWRQFIDGPEPNRGPRDESPDPFDDYESVEVFIPRDTLRRAEAIAEERGTNVGDLIADSLAIGIVTGRGA